MSVIDQIGDERACWATLVLLGWTEGNGEHRVFPFFITRRAIGGELEYDIAPGDQVARGVYRYCGHLFARNPSCALRYETTRMGKENSS
jgi:hypothetical protein